jgi:hypothetical protein
MVGWDGHVPGFRVRHGGIRLQNRILERVDLDSLQTLHKAIMHARDVLLDDLDD